MDLFEAMMTQKSIRRYNDEPVSDDEIRQCLKAAVQAPNGGNSQPWEWLVVRDDEKKRAIGEWYRKAFHERYWPAITRLAANNAQAVSEKARKPGERTAASAIHLADHLGEAEALVMLIGARAERDWELRDDQGLVDIGRTYYTSLVPALQNFMLAARGLGIGTCLTTLFRVHQEEIRGDLRHPGRDGDRGFSADGTTERQLWHRTAHSGGAEDFLGFLGRATRLIRELRGR